MSPLSWLLLLVIYFATLVVGMLIFHSTECPKELETLRAKRFEDLKLTALVNKMENMLVGKVYEELDEVLEPGEMEQLVRIWSSGKVVTRENQMAGNESQAAEVCVLLVPMPDKSSYFKSRYQSMIDNGYIANSYLLRCASSGTGSTPSSLPSQQSPQ